jgi:hypothetical protein
MEILRAARSKLGNKGLDDRRFLSVLHYPPLTAPVGGRFRLNSVPVPLFAAAPDNDLTSGLSQDLFYFADDQAAVLDDQH